LTTSTRKSFPEQVIEASDSNPRRKESSISGHVTYTFLQLSSTLALCRESPTLALLPLILPSGPERNYPPPLPVGPEGALPPLVLGVVALRGKT